MANNELDAILAEIRKKAQENDIPEQTPEAEQLPVEVVDAPAAEPKPEQEDVFSDILKAVGAAETKQSAPAPAPAVPQEEPKAPADVPDEAPESIFTFTEDAPPAAPEAEAANSEELPVDKEEPIVVPNGKAFDTKTFGLITGAAAAHPAEELPEEPEPEDGDGGEGGKAPGNKKVLVIVLAVLLLIAAGVGIYFGFFHHKKEEPTETQPPVTESQTIETVTQKGAPVNPLTGESGFNEAAIGKRPVAVVVENEYSTKAIRPQWGIEDADIIMEGETEYSTRMLFFWADYTALPEKVGPTRSARPPFIRFSQLFDSVFIHAGLSRSKGNYVGADSVFESDNIDHINLLSLSEDGTYFGRDRSRTSTVEHTGYLNGTKAAELIEKQGFRTDADANRFTQFEFNKKTEATGTQDAKTVKFTWSNACPKHAKFTFIDSEGIYRTSDFDEQGREADLQFETLILLLDETEYIVKENYKGSQSETYCDYHLAGGKGLIASEGKATEITWEVKDGKLVMQDENGKDVKLNPGKIYIGYGSSNHGGSYEAEGAATEDDGNN